MRLATEVTGTESLFEILANNSPVGLYIAQDGRFCYTNPTFQSTTGYTEDELAGRDALDLVVPEDREMVRKNAIKMLKGKLTSPYQFRVTHRTGSIKWVMESVSSIQYHGRRATLGHFTDITEHKQAEEALREAEEEKSVLLEEAPVGIMHTDLTGKITYINKRFESESGYSREEIVNKNGLRLDWLPAGTIKHLAKRMEARLRGKPAKSWETQFKCKDGRWIWVELEGKVLRKLGVPASFQIIARNITERKKAEEQLQESEQYLKTLFNASAGGILVIDPETHEIVDANSTVIKMIGIERDQIIGHKCHKFVCPAEVGKCPITDLRQKVDSSERMLLKANGESVSVLKSVVPIIRHGRQYLLELMVDITERKKAEETIQAEKNKLQSLIDAMEDSLVIQDTEYNIVYQNEVSKKIFGDRLGEKCYRVFEGRERVCGECPVEKAFKDGKSHNVERRVVLPSEEVIIWENTASLIRDAEGRIVSCLEIGRNITERKQSEEALQTEKNKLQALVDAMEQGLTIQDRDYNIIYQNGSMIKAYGHHLGKKCYKAYEVREKVCDGCPVKKAFKDGKPHTSERRVVLPSGETLFMENTANPIRDSKGDVVSCLEIVRNITERKQAEEALRQSREALRKMFESVTDGIIVTDFKGVITETNQRTTEMHGFASKDELVGRNALELVAPRDRERMTNSMREALKQGTVRGVEHTLIKADGGEFPAELSTSVLKDASGNAVAHITIVRDITERRRAEEKVKHLNVVLRAIRNINQLIARTTDRDSLLKGACDNFVETRGYYSAWIALLDESGKLVTAAEAGLDKSFLQAMERLKHGKLPHCGYKVLEKPGVLVMKDISSECEDCPLVKECAGRGAMSIRLKYGGKLYGVMTVSMPPGRVAEKEEHGLFKEIAEDIAFALHSMEQKQERKRAEEALRASEEMYKTVVEDAPLGIYYNDFSGKFLYGNKRAEEIVGYKVEALLGKSFLKLKLLGPEGIAKAAKLLALNKLGKATGPDVFTLNRKDGTTSIVEIRTKLSTFGGKKAVLGMVEDITERKKAEEELSKTQAQLSSAVQMAHLGPWEYDVINDLFTFNDAFYELFHTTAEEVGGYTMSSAEYARRFVHPEDAHLIDEEGRKALQQADDPNFSRQFDHRIIYADGKVGYISVRLFIRKDETGSPVGIYGVNQDITERKQAEQALQAEKNKLQSLIDAVEDTITIQDKDFNIIYQNEPSKIASGGDHLGEKCYRAYEGRETVCDRCPVEEAFTDGKSHTAERLTKIAGKVAFWENTANPIRDSEGKIVSCLELARDITERKKQEQALADELTQRRLLIDKSLDGIVVLNEDAKVVEANQRFAEMLGYTLEEAHELHTWDWDKEFPPEKLLEMGRNVDEKGLHLETKHTRKDGSVIDVDISISGIKCGGQKLIFCIQRDITERKEQEQALADELTRRRLLVDQSPDGIVVLDENDKVYEANQSFAEMLGYTLEEIRELHTWDWEKNYSREQIHAQGMKADEKGFFLETTHTRKDGSVIDVDISINASIFGGQKLIFCVCRDVTERKKMEEALKLAAEEWRGTFDSITDAISIHDKDFRIQRANKAFADIFHVRPNQIIGRHCYELHKGEKPISGCPHKQTLATGKPAVAEFYESHLGKYLLESTSPIFDEKGEVVSTIHITRDITEQKQQNERLMMADRLASIGELAAGTAHELNNPLTSVLGFTQLIMEKDIPDDMREDLKLIHNEAQRAAGVTKNLLTFARKHTPVKQLNQINDIIEDVLKLRTYEHKLNGIEVQRQLAPDLPEIEVDYFQMQQVFLNIIINAEYFMIEAHNRGTLTITTKKRNGNVRISIADDGPGIPPENLSRIFNPFFTTKAAGKGTGLGLSICHGIVAEHGGQIYAKSQPGKGTTIFVELPANGH